MTTALTFSSPSTETTPVARAVERGFAVVFVYAFMLPLMVDLAVICFAKATMVSLRISAKTSTSFS